MANIYIDSNAAGAGTGADWANACTTLAAGFTAGAAGDTFYVAHNHAETQASAMTLNCKGTAASPSRVICVNSGGSVPPVSADLRTTATVTTTGANGFSFPLQNGYYEGITFNCGTGATNANFAFGNIGTKIHYKNCALRKLGTNQTSMAINFGQSAANTIIMENTTVQFGSSGGDAIAPPHQLYWFNTPSNAITGATVPARLFSLSNNSGQILVEGVDLSLLDSGEELVIALSNSATFVFKDCKLGASVTTASAPTVIGPSVSLIRCDSGDTNYRTEKVMYQGTLTTETTTVRTGGASDGTTTIAWKIVPTANNERVFPFECFPISIWNETTGSAVTLTIEGTWAGGAVPTTNDIWMNVEALTTSGFPVGAFTNGNVDSLAAGTNHTSSSETWGAGGTTKFKMAVSVTPQEKGPITVYIKYAHTTNTVWIDPKITVS